MHTCNNCGRNYEKYSKLERHNNARNPCRPPTHLCDNCNKGFASYQSLWKHKQRCQRPSHYINYPVGDKRPADILDHGTGSMSHVDTMVNAAAAAKESSLEPRRPKNPKIQLLMDEIINGNLDQMPVQKLNCFKSDKATPLLLHRESVIETKKHLSAIDPPPIASSNLLSKNKENLIDYGSDDDDVEESDTESIVIDDSPPDNVRFLPTTVAGLRARLEKVIKNIIKVRKSDVHEKTDTGNEAVALLDELKRQGGISRRMYRQYNNFLGESLPAGFGIVGDEAVDVNVEEMDASNNEEDGDEELSSSEDDLEKEENGHDMEAEAFVLPDNIEGIADRFNELYVEFVRKERHENRKELEFLLDEMLRQGAIDPIDYTMLNTRLTMTDDRMIDKEEKEEDEEDEEEENMENAAIQYLILHDKDELEELMVDIKEEIDVEFKDIVNDIEKLLETFFVEEFIDGEAIRPQIDALLNQLESSNISKAKQIRIIMLLDTIEKNRYRVKQIFQRLMDAESKENMLNVLKMLVREGLLSDDQFESLTELKEPDLQTIKEVITNTKVGDGLNLLPRTLSSLRHTLQSLLKDLKESGGTFLKSKVITILDELLRRNAIRPEEYENLIALTV